MNFFKKLFASDEKLEQSDDFGSKPESNLPLEQDEYDRLNLTRPVTDQEFELVSVITSAIFAGDKLNSNIRIVSIKAIDEYKEAAAIVASLAAANDKPSSSFKLLSVEELRKDENITHA